MPTQGTQLFTSIDAGQGGGAKTVDASTELEGDLFNDVKTAISFNAVGSQRMTNLPGKIGAGQSGLFRYVPADTLDTLNDLYGDMIAAYNLNTLVTIVVRLTDAVKGTTNPEITLIGYQMTNPATFADNDKVASDIQLDLTSVQWDDGVVDITWS